MAEMGYASAVGTAQQPWEWGLATISQQEQADAYQGFLQAWYLTSWCKGLFIWDVEWFAAYGVNNTELNPLGKLAGEIIKQAWT